MTIKKYLKISFKNFLALAGLAWVFPGFAYGEAKITLILAAVVLTAINIFIRPVIKLLLLPINLISFGMFAWIINVVNLVILAFFIKEIEFKAYQFPGFWQNGFAIPPIYFSQIVSLIVCSFLLSLIKKLIKWLLANDD